MPDSNRTKRLAKELVAGSRQAMAVIVRNVPPSYNWGWYSREDQRMHLQSVDAKHRMLGYKVWLESKGKRVFEPEPGIPSKVLEPLRDILATRERLRVEVKWVAFMLDNHWLSLRVEGMLITITAYPKTHNQFVRSLDIRSIIRNPEYSKLVKPDQVSFNREILCLEVAVLPTDDEGRRHHLPLDEILWGPLT
jgi:hypothetical protein